MWVTIWILELLIIITIQNFLHRIDVCTVVRCFYKTFLYNFLTSFSQSFNEWNILVHLKLINLVLFNVLSHFNLKLPLIRNHWPLELLLISITQRLFGHWYMSECGTNTFLVTGDDATAHIVYSEDLLLLKINKIRRNIHCLGWQMLGGDVLHNRLVLIRSLWFLALLRSLMQELVSLD